LGAFLKGIQPKAGKESHRSKVERSPFTEKKNGFQRQQPPPGYSLFHHTTNCRRGKRKKGSSLVCGGFFLVLPKVESSTPLKQRLRDSQETHPPGGKRDNPKRERGEGASLTRGDKRTHVEEGQYLNWTGACQQRHHHLRMKRERCKKRMAGPRRNQGRIFKGRQCRPQGR